MYLKQEDAYIQAIRKLEGIFNKNGDKLQKVKEIAVEVKKEIEKISLFIELNSQKICIVCKGTCCINKNSYYNFEDFIYIHALGLNPPDFEFGLSDLEHCQFLSEKGCSFERSFRPSGCNWYFCNAMFEEMEKSHDYESYDNSLTDVIERWKAMMEEWKSLQIDFYAD